MSTAAKVKTFTRKNGKVVTIKPKATALPEPEPRKEAPPPVVDQEAKDEPDDVDQVDDQEEEEDLPAWATALVIGGSFLAAILVGRVVGAVFARGIDEGEKLAREVLRK